MVGTEHASWTPSWTEAEEHSDGAAGTGSTRTSAGASPARHGAAHTEPLLPHR